MTLKAAVVPAIPSASVRTETVVKPGVRARRRRVGRISATSDIRTRSEVDYSVTAGYRNAFQVRTLASDGPASRPLSGRSQRRAVVGAAAERGVFRTAALQASVSADPGKRRFRLEL